VERPGSAPYWIVGGATVVAVAIVVLAIVLTNGGHSIATAKVNPNPVAKQLPVRVPNGDTSEPREPEPAAPAPPAPDVQAPSLGSYSATYYSVDRPADWTTESDDQQQSGGWLRSQWRDPSDSSTSVLIDAQEEQTTAQDKADEVRAATSGTPGYREISLRQTTMNGVPAVRWEFEVSGTHRVDYFVHDDSCGVGVAVLGVTGPASWSGLEQTFSDIADSVSIDCSSVTPESPPDAPASSCDPNYEGACLDPTSSDYDCDGGSGNGPDYTGEVTVVGDDHFDLDRDGDGTACEPY
jgi:hypothetical protein